ncbi:uncharacterized protein LOC125758760 [Rhipicephalus sanguineus]|uniref:uncharacterized protein LOC125758760 n=1 Tax=Rhipicephalus sanguineus TaxID=34632 RepID=UPI0020C1DACC|nr:uncharacterized protein LOC125758760 [Rhipicephalus sanguineus]
MRQYREVSSATAARCGPRGVYVFKVLPRCSSSEDADAECQIKKTRLLNRKLTATLERLPCVRILNAEHRFLNSSKEPRRAFLAIDGYHVHRGQGIDQLAKIIVSSLARDFGPGVKSHAHSELGICYRLLKCSHCNTKGHEVLRVQQIPSPTFPT